MTHIKGAGQRTGDAGAMVDISGFLDTHHALIEAQLARILSAARAADWGTYRARFVVLRASVLDHIAYEDQVLFPEVVRVLGSENEVLALREEHERLRQHFETLGAAAPEHDPAGCMGELEDLNAFVRQHHKRELRVCYPAADRFLPGDAALAQGARALVDAARVEFGADLPPPLDLRGLQPPEPIVRIFAALERAPDKPLRAILPHEPVPLYALLRDRGFRCGGGTRPDGGYDLLIEKA